ncbi:MAG TPA: sialidase family protein [Terracidiphilus sp.]|nr:sialidase family protein [Terracidiphilus sp.]
MGLLKCATLVVMMGVLTAVAHGQNGDGLIFPPLSSGKALPGTQANNHASTVVELKGGDVMVAWFAGSREGAPDVKIYGARLHDGAWSAPVVLASADGVACWNPVLFHTHDGRLWLYYKYGTHPSTWKGARKWSDDEGRTWSKIEYLPDGILGPIKDKPLVLPDGTIVSGSSVENGKWNAWIERSTDNGKAWTKFGPITVPASEDVPGPAVLAAAGGKQAPPADGMHTKVYPPSKTTVGIIQPSVVWMVGEHLRFFARSRTRASRIAIADSWDDGKTWTQAHFIDLPNPNSGIDAVRLKDGRIVLAFNNSYNERTPLNLAVSRDGEHFRIFKTLEDGPGQYSYPAIIQAANGDLLITYTWRRESINFVRLPLAAVPEIGAGGK